MNRSVCIHTNCLLKLQFRTCDEKDHDMIGKYFFLNKENNLQKKSSNKLLHRKKLKVTFFQLQMTIVSNIN